MGWFGKVGGCTTRVCAISFADEESGLLNSAGVQSALAVVVYKITCSVAMGSASSTTRPLPTLLRIATFKQNALAATGYRLMLLMLGLPHLLFLLSCVASFHMQPRKKREKPMHWIASEERKQRDDNITPALLHLRHHPNRWAKPHTGNEYAWRRARIG